MKVAWDSVSVAGSRAVPWDVAFRVVAAENTPSGLSGIWLGLMVPKGRTLARITGLLFIGRNPVGLMLESRLD